MPKLIGVEFSPLRVPFYRRLQTLAACHYISVWVIGPVLSLWLIVHLVLNICTYWWLILFYLAWFIYDRNTPKLGGRKFGVKSFRNFAVWRHLRDYFPIHLHKTVDLNPEKNYLIGLHPHGIVSLGGFVNFATEANRVSTEVFPALTFHLGTLRGQFFIPVRREYCMMTGCIEVSKESIKHTLNNSNKGEAVVLVVGGASEVLEARPGNFNVLLKNRKGFIKLALQTGANLVPAFSFGENDVYMQLANPPESTLRKAQKYIKNELGFGLGPPLFHGRGIFQYSLGLLPFRKPINTVVGAPMEIESVKANPSGDQIDELHEKYVVRLIELFEEHKGRFGIEKEIHLNII